MKATLVTAGVVALALALAPVAVADQDADFVFGLQKYGRVPITGPAKLAGNSARQICAAVADGATPSMVDALAQQNYPWMSGLELSVFKTAAMSTYCP